jgi:hypothetical protein
MTISGSQAAFVPVRRKGWHAGLMDGGWVSLFEHFTGQLGQEAEDGRYPAGPATWTFRTARGGSVHLEFSVPVAASPALAVTVQPVHEQFALAAEEFQARGPRGQGRLARPPPRNRDPILRRRCHPGSCAAECLEERESDPASPSLASAPASGPGRGLRAARVAIRAAIPACGSPWPGRDKLLRLSLSREMSWRRTPIATDR